jgi:hypothetical protein
VTELLTLTAGDLYPVVRATLTDDVGAALDLTGATSATFLLRRVGAAAPVVNAAATIVSPATDGVVEYAWAFGDTDIPGDYDAAFRVDYTIGGVTYPTVDRLRVRILPNLADVTTAPEWAFITPAAAATLVGQDISEADLFAAQGMIAVFADVTGAPVLSGRDAVLLGTATAYQAAFVAANPDLLTAADVTALSQDGASAQFDGADARLLAPMARRCLNRLSWRGALRSLLLSADSVAEVVEEDA